MPAVGRKASGKHTQSVLFSKAAWTEERARKWCKDHDYFTDGMDESDDFYRFRQYDPDPAKFEYRNEVIEKTKDGKTSIELVLGIPKGQTKGSNSMSLINQLKNIQAEKKNLVDSVSTLKTEKETLVVEAAKIKSELDAKIQVMTDEAVASKLAGEKLTTDLIAAIKRAEDAENELKTAKAILLEPAFKDAQAPGQAPVQNAPEAADKKKKPCYAEYQEIKDPVLRSRFWNEHEAEIKAEMKELNK